MLAGAGRAVRAHDRTGASRLIPGGFVRSPPPFPIGNFLSLRAKSVFHLARFAEQFFNVRAPALILNFAFLTLNSLAHA
jgi:hypothetical protein